MEDWSVTSAGYLIDRAAQVDKQPPAICHPKIGRAGLVQTSCDQITSEHGLSDPIQNRKGFSFRVQQPFFFF
jgi:hypothetical protein